MDIPDQIVWVLGLWAMTTTFALMLMGKKGFMWLKLNLPWVKNRGAWYIKGFQNNYVEIDFGVSKPEILWSKDRKTGAEIKTFIEKPANQELGTGKPIIFAYEGQPSNFNPFDDMIAMKGVEWLSQIVIQAENSGFNRGKDSVLSTEKRSDWVFWISIGTLVLVLAVLIVSMQQGEILTHFQQYYDAAKPAIEKAIASAASGSVLR